MLSDLVVVSLISLVGVIFTGWMQFKNTQLLSEVKKNTDGLASAAQESADRAGRAEGKAEEMEKSRVRALEIAAVVASDKEVRAAEDIAEAEARPGVSDEPMEVKVIADEEAPVTVKVVEKGKGNGA